MRFALMRIGVHLTVTESKGDGRQRAYTEIYRGADYTVNFVPKLKVEVAVRSDQVDSSTPSAGPPRRAKSATVRSSLFELEQAVRSRTGEDDNDAL
jgi:nitrogen regulatory protein P-II 2